MRPGEWYWAEVLRRHPRALFDTIGHLDVIKRWLVPYYGPFEFEAHATCTTRVLPATGRRAGPRLEVNSSGLRTDIAGPFPHPGEPYPPAGGGRRVFRALGGTRVVAGSDAHRVPASPAR